VFFPARYALIVRVPGLEHRRKSGGFFLPAFLGAGFFEPPMQANHLQSLFAIEFLFETAKGLFDGLASF
jgi:hypothetical protein